jgi:hypothetical protein
VIGVFGGGVSDKFGNIYEARWTARMLLQVLRGEASSIRLEGIAKDFQGFEFAVQYDGHTAWHQTKINAPQGNWTINALEREGVLGAITRRISANAVDRCVFVSQSSMNPLAALASKAAYADGYSDFADAIGKGAAADFRTLGDTLKITPERAYDWLRRCEFRVLPEDEISRLIEAHAELFFASSSATAFVDLRAFLEARMNREITMEQVRDELERSTSIRIKDWSLSPALRVRLKDETSAYLSTHAPFGAGGQAIPREQVKEVFDHVVNPQGPLAVLLSGVAGTGKSGVVRGVIAELEKAGVTHLAFRVDHLLDSKSPRDFGQSLLGRDESPVTTLKGTEPDRPTVLIVDQIDAVSEVSGRNGAAKNAVLRLIDEARAYGTVRVLLVCRTFDIESDERIKALRDTSDVATVQVPTLTWVEDVAPVLSNLSIDASQFSDAQKQLLCLPVNLTVYVAVAAETGTSFATRKDLFDRLLAQKERAITQGRTVPWAAEAPLSVLAEWMSERQRLEAPENVLASYARALDLLQSEQLIVRYRGGISFFHESFFDYMFARRFSASDQTVVDLLLSSEQHLFRRTQVRQILEHLRQGDTKRYLGEVKAVLLHRRVRLHVKTAVAQWLATLPDPTASERDLVLGLDQPDQTLPLLPRMVVYGSVGWFDRLHDIGWDAAQLVKPTREQQTLWWLSKYANARPEIVAKLLDDWWGGDPVRASKLIQWFGYIHPRVTGVAITDLCERVIRSRPEGLFSGEGALRREVLLSDIVADGDRTAAGRTLRALLDVWYEVHPGHHPFERDELKEMDLHSLGEFAKRSPLAFIEATMDALIQAFHLIAQQDHDARDYTFTMRIHGGHSYGSDRFLRLFRTALATVAVDDPDAARAILARIDPSQHEAATHLHLETVAANGAALADLLLPLLDSPFLFEAGWHGADWRSFADAARMAIPHLSHELRAAVERAILDYRPEIDFAARTARELKAGNTEEWYRNRRVAIHYLAESGYEQFCILQTMGTSALTPPTARLLEQLSRKFRDRKPEEPNDFEVYTVLSPINSERAARLTDAQWLSAMEAHFGEGPFFSPKHTGGARELGQTLRQEAKEHPDRFARLVLTIRESANTSYTEQIISGLAEADTVDLPLVRAAIAHADQRLGKPHGQAIARAFEKHPLLAKDAASLDILLWYAANGDASDDEEAEAKRVERETITIEDLLERGGRLQIRGLNGARGWALEAFASVLWHVPEAVDLAWSFLEDRIQHEQLVSVRCCIPRALAPLFNVDKQRASLLLEALARNPSVERTTRFDQLASSLAFAPRWIPMPIRRWLAAVGGSLLGKSSKPDQAKWIAPLATHPGTHLLPYIVYQVPQSGRRLLLRLLCSGDTSLRLIGVWHVLRTGFNSAEYVPLAEALERESIEGKRLAADVSADAVVHDEFRLRAKQKLVHYFDDDDSEVRKHAANVFRSIPSDQFSDFMDLAHRFVRSPAYVKDSFSFLHALENAHSNVTELIATAAERALEELRRPGNDLRGHDMEMHQLKDLIRDEYAASERSPEVRKRLLDIIDGMAELELYGVDEIIRPHER